MSGRYIPFAGEEAVKYPQIGNTYNARVDDFAFNSEDSRFRPLILIGFYKHQGKVVALDFICPTTRRVSDKNYDSERYNLFLENIVFSNFGKAGCHISCASILTVPNNPDIVLSGTRDHKMMPFMIDYLLRRATTFYDGKAKWKKDASIPAGAVRYGFNFDQLDANLFALKDRFAPDHSHADHLFSHAAPETVPAGIRNAFDTVLDWATRARIKALQFGQDGICDLPALRSFPAWSEPCMPYKKIIVSEVSRRPANSLD